MCRFTEKVICSSPYKYFSIVIISFVEKNVSYKHKNIFIAIYSYKQTKHISLLHLLKTDICA